MTFVIIHNTGSQDTSHTKLTVPVQLHWDEPEGALGEDEGELDRDKLESGEEETLEGDELEGETLEGDEDLELDDPHGVGQ